MDRSNSNSEHSNLFVISSQSSRSETRQPKKESYVRFAKKVKDLLDVSGNDLDELYQKVEKIVVKYFQEHRVVDFEEMYVHIASLKSNSAKMNEIVNVLEKRLAKSSNSSYEQGRKSSKTQEFQTTLNSHKQRNSLHYDSAEGNKEDILNIFNEKELSDKHNIAFQPSNTKEKGHEMTPKVIRSKKQSEATPSNYSPSKVSPSKTNIEEYYNRNRQYDQKIKEILKEVNAIKQSIPIKQTQSIPIKPTQSIPIKQTVSAEQSNMMINLRQNGQKLGEGEPKSSIKQIDQLIIGSNNEKVMDSSLSQQNKTPNSSQINELTNITSKQYELQHKIGQIKQDNKINERQMNLSLMLKSSETIARQIRQAKEVASRLQITSREIQQNQQSQTQILPPEKINTLIKKMSEEKNKKQPILEQIENTTSQVKISENMIPSFKNLPNHSPNATKTRQIFTTQLNIPTVKTPINVSFNSSATASPSNLLSSSQIVHSFKPAEQSYNLSTIKYVYNPYPNSVYPNRSLYIRPEPARVTPIIQPVPIPIQRFGSNQRQLINKRQTNHIYINQISSPISSSNNSSTSIMHPHLFSRERESSSQVSQLQTQKSYINQLQKSPINTIYSYPSVNRSIGSAQSVQSSLNSNSSTNSLHRKGLNLTNLMEKRS